MSLQLSFAEASAIGPREENQDALRLVTPAPALAASKGYLFAIADGVSQCADGGLAARSTLQALALDYYATPETWGVAQALDRLLLAQNRWLQANGGGQPLLTTVSALVMRGRRFTLAHVGDCRVYRWHADTLQRVSEDHVWDQPGMQHVLKRALGLDQHLVLDFLDGELRARTKVSYCSAMASGPCWATPRLRQFCAINRICNSAAQTLVNAAHLAGSQDNASALLVRVDALGETSIGDALIHLQQWPLPPALKPGQTFEGWQVEGILGQSQQSLLYRVRDGQQQPWLLKTLPGALRDDHLAGQALLSEEWFLKRVAGRHFPEVHAASQRQHLYYVMREYSGSTLAELHEQMSDRCLWPNGWIWPNACCAPSAYCIDGRFSIATSNRRTCCWGTTANCACWTSVSPTALACLKISLLPCPERPAISRRKPFAGKHRHRNRICMPSA